MSFRDRLLRTVDAEQVRTQQRIVNEAVTLGGVPGISAREIAEFIKSEEFRTRMRGIGVTAAEVLGLE
jgi:hypothetical protein